MELSQTLDYLEPHVRRRVAAAMKACAFVTTEELERITQLDAEPRATAVRELAPVTRPGARIYAGYISGADDEERRVIVIPQDGAPVYALPDRCDLFNHSPNGFAWGYSGSGPAQLALAILADHLGNDRLAIRLHQKFKFALVSGLKGDAPWCLTPREIDAALQDILAAKVQ